MQEIQVRIILCNLHKLNILNNILNTWRYTPGIIHFNITAHSNQEVVLSGTFDYRYTLSDAEKIVACWIEGQQLSNFLCEKTFVVLRGIYTNINYKYNIGQI